MNNNEGYIYIYKCVIGSGSDVCKIGITKNFHDRLKQHVRTPYYGFMPYIEFTTGNPIATVFKINNYDLADNLINELFKEKQIGNYEVYNIYYEDAIKMLYFELKKKNRIIELVKEDYTDYDEILTEFNYNNTDNEDTKIGVFKELEEQIVYKYNGQLPEEVLVMLRDKDDYIKNCYSHYKRGNYVDFPNNMILDLNYNRATRIGIKKKLTEILNNKKHI